MGESATKAGEEFKKQLDLKISEVGNTLKTKFGEIFNLKTILGSGGTGLAAGGIFGSLIVNLPKLTAGFATLSARVAPFFAGFSSFLPILLRFSAAGLALYLIWKNWDTILPAITNTVKFLTDQFNRFMTDIGGMEGIKNLFTETFGPIFNYDFSGFDLQSILVAPFTALADVITGTDLAGIFTSIVQSIGAFFEEGRLGNEIILLMKDSLAFLAAIFGDADGGASNFMQTLKTVGQVIAGIVGIILNVGISLVQAFIDTLPFIEGVFVGVIRTIRGFIQFFTGIVQIVRGVILLIVGLFTGDFQGGIELLLTGFASVQSGLLTIWDGILTTVINALHGIIVAIWSFAGNFINNINTAFYGGTNEAFTIFSAFADDVITSVTDLGNSIITTFRGWIDNIIQQTLDLYDEMVGNSIIPDMVNDIIEWLTVTLPSDVIAGITTFASDLVSNFSTMATDALNAFTSALGTFDLSSWFSSGEEQLNLANSGVTPTTDTTAMQAQFGTFIQTLTALTTQFNTFWAQSELLKQQQFATTILNTQVLYTSYLLSMQTATETFVVALQTKATNLFNFLQTTVKTFEQLVLSVLQQIEAAIDRLIAKFRELGEVAKETAAEIKDEFKDAEKGLKKLEPVIDKPIEKLKKMEEAAKKAADAAKDAGGSGGAPSGKARGGPVKAGVPYIVGERGRELFVPAMNGAIVPNNILNQIFGASQAKLQPQGAYKETSASVTNNRVEAPINATINTPMDLQFLRRFIIQTVQEAVR